MSSTKKHETPLRCLKDDKRRRGLRGTMPGACAEIDGLSCYGAKRAAFTNGCDMRWIRP